MSALSPFQICSDVFTPLTIFLDQKNKNSLKNIQVSKKLKTFFRQDGKDSLNFKLSRVSRGKLPFHLADKVMTEIS